MIFIVVHMRSGLLLAEACGHHIMVTNCSAAEPSVRACSESQLSGHLAVLSFELHSKQTTNNPWDWEK